jgi:hypothetical protein
MKVLLNAGEFHYVEYGDEVVGRLGRLGGECWSAGGGGLGPGRVGQPAGATRYGGGGRPVGGDSAGEVVSRWGWGRCGGGFV